MTAKRTTFVALLATILFVSPLLAQAPPKKEVAKTTASRVEKKTYDFKLAGKEMEYAQFVPSNYDKEKTFPLMVCLHGLFSNPQQIIRYKGLTDLAEKHGYVLVAPMGYNTTGWYGAKSPLGSGKTDPENLSELSEKDVMNVLGIARKEFNIDPDRIFLMGHSMGGGGTLHLAIKHPDIWAGLAPIAPAIYRPATDVAKIQHIPVIVVQGAKDFLVPASGTRKWIDEMKKLDMKHQYIEDPNGDHTNVAITYLPKIFEFFATQKRNGK
ncbi:MAG: poly(3-hydroxybutyrate) depolymerase [Gemmataceae bacterium]|nr:poly(3-hydroxybutyrate) depolymerase [Gemmataceae bacterium]